MNYVLFKDFLHSSVGQESACMFWENSIETSILSGWNRSPAQVGCMRQVLRAGALGRPRGIGWRRRWEGGSGWGTHINPWLIHVNVWQKSLQYCKVTSLQLIKINGKKEKERICLQCRRPGLIPGSRWSAGEGRVYPLQYSWVSLVAQLVKNWPAMWETWVRSLG